MLSFGSIEIFTQSTKHLNAKMNNRACYAEDAREVGIHM